MPAALAAASRRVTDVLRELRQAGDLDVPPAAHVVERLLDARGIRPLLVRHENLEIRVPRQIRIGIGGDIQAAPPRRLDDRDDFRRLAPDADGAELDVRDLDWKACLFADRNGLPDGFERAVSLVTDVRDVKAAVSRRHARQCHELGGRSVAADLVLEPRREADRSIRAFLLDERLHPRDLGCRRLPAEVVAHHGPPDGGMPDEHRDIHRCRRRPAASEVIAERQWRAAILPQKDGCYALGHLRARVRISNPVRRSSGCAHR